MKLVYGYKLCVSLGTGSKVPTTGKPVQATAHTKSIAVALRRAGERTHARGRHRKPVPLFSWPFRN